MTSKLIRWGLFLALAILPVPGRHPVSIPALDEIMPPIGQYDAGPATRYHETFRPAIHQALVGLMDRYWWPRRHPAGAREIREAIYHNSLICGLDPLRVGVQIARESGFYPRARSRCGAKGLMQIMPLHYQWLGITNPYDIWQSIRGGCILMQRYEAQHGNWRTALARYNGGQRGVRLTSRRAETRRYVAWITREHGRIVTALGGRPAPAEASAGGVYVVRPGDTLWGIARRHRTTVARLAAANGIENPDLIRVGQELRIQ